MARETRVQFQVESFWSKKKKKKNDASLLKSNHYKVRINWKRSIQEKE